MALILNNVENSAPAISSNDDSGNTIRLLAENNEAYPQHGRGNAPLSVQISPQTNQDAYGTRRSDSAKIPILHFKTLQT